MLLPIYYSGFNANKFDPVLIHIWDANYGESGTYRVVTPSDLSATVNVTGDLLVNVEQIEGQLSGISGSLNDVSGDSWLYLIYQNQLNQLNGNHGVVTSGNQFRTNNGDFLDANPSRKSWGIQNLGTGALFVKMGGTAGPTSFSTILKAGTVADDGNGASYIDTSALYTGVVSASGQFTRFSFWEIS